MIHRHLYAAGLALLMGGCKDVEEPHGHHHDHETITTVALTFTPAVGGEARTFQWAEVEGPPVMDTILLDQGVDYVLDVVFLNEHEDPAEDVTPEIADEADEHQVFFTGTAVEGPATGANPQAPITQDYADQDPNGHPLGLRNASSAIRVGSGDLTVTLRHLPTEDGQSVKGPALAEDVASGGFAAIGGDNDVDATFPLTVE